MTRRSVPIALSAALAWTAAAPAAPARGGYLEVLRRAQEQILESASAGDPAAARRAAQAAAEALEGLPPDTCAVVLPLTEARLRAARLQDARSSLERARELGCDEADVMHLHAFALELGTDGTRRGEGAHLRAAEAAYLRAAALLARRPLPDPSRRAAALAAAGELALLRGDPAAALDVAERAVKASSDPALRPATCLLLVRAAAPLLGEGHALERGATCLAPRSPDELLATRMQDARSALERGDDPQALAASAFYALLAGDQVSAARGLRALRRAIELDETLPDAWYLLGRCHEALEQHLQAKEAYRRQLQVRPDAPASILAANALATLVADLPGSEEELTETLAHLDTQLARRPAEAAMLETRARLLLAAGRERDACASARKAAELAEPDTDASRDARAFVHAHCGGG